MDSGFGYISATTYIKKNDVKQFYFLHISFLKLIILLVIFLLMSLIIFYLIVVDIRYKFIGYVELKEMFGLPMVMAMEKDVEIDNTLIAEAKEMLKELAG